jgi:hypothetical protein
MIKTNTMKTSKRVLVLLLMLILGLASCEKEEDQNTNTGTPTFALADFFTQTRAPLQSFTVSATTGGQITGTKGTRVYFPASSFQTSSGQAVTGNVTVELREMLKGADMILSNATTTSDGKLLISGGQIFLQATQNGNELKLAPNAQVYVQIPTDNPITMNVFTGELTANDSLIGDSSINWTAVIDTSTTVGISQDSSSGTISYVYTFPIENLGYINCDYFYGNGDPLTTISVVCPAQHVDSNTAVFLYFPAINSVTRLHDYDSDATFELGSGYEVPIGLNVKVVVISQIGTQYYYQIQPQVITANLVVNSTPAAATFSQVQTAVQNL